MRRRDLQWTSLTLAVLVGLTGWAGLFQPATYAQETRSWAAQALGGDVLNLGLIVPLLLVTAHYIGRGSSAARLVWLGVLGYLFYNFLIYCFAVHFNGLFLVYCAVLGVSFFGFIGGVLSLAPLPAEEAPRSRALVYGVATVFILMAAATSVQWLREIAEALAAGGVPRAARDIGMPVNPVWVLDLSFLLPALAITAVMLLKRRPLAFVLAPALLTTLALISCELIAMMAAMVRAGLLQGYGPLGFFLVLLAIFSGLLAAMLRAGAVREEMAKPVTATA